MSTMITNYDGSIHTTPQQLVRPQTVEELQEILRHPERYPSPVRAMGSYHSLTPCVSTPGTVVSMSGMKKIIKIDHQNMTLTAQAGLQMIEANEALRKEKLQLMLNIEIGNMTIGSAACCHSKDSLDGAALGQVNSYMTGVKWVTPNGELAEASEEKNPELLPLIRASYGLAGVVYEVTFKIKPLEIIKFDYHIHDVDELTEDAVAGLQAKHDSMVCWTIGGTAIIQTRSRATELKHDWLGKSRRFGWNFLAAFAGRAIRDHGPGPLSDVAEELGSGVELGFYRLLSATGGFTLYAPDKMVNYSKTPQKARYAFTFWAFPRADWVKNLKGYVEFAESYHKQHGFRCNMPLGSYFIRKDTSSLLSYSYDGDIFSLDPIHAPGEREQDAWANFLRAFNEWAHQRGGIPLLNQSPFVTRAHVVSAYGDRWTKLCDWVRSVDPSGRMVNPFFQDLLVGEGGRASTAGRP